MRRKQKHPRKIVTRVRVPARTDWRVRREESITPVRHIRLHYQTRVTRDVYGNELTRNERVVPEEYWVHEYDFIDAPATPELVRE